MKAGGEKLDAEVAARIGRVLNEKWTLEKLLGIGGMGSVYLGRHRNGAKAAVKILHAELAQNPDVRERFLREGYAANRVEHRGAVQVLDDDVVDDGPDEGAAYLVMELLEGESLEDRAARAPPFSEKEFLAVAEGVLDVLEAAHDHGVIHRDLKPDNIFLVDDPDDPARGFQLRVKLLDFGLARLAERQGTTQFGLALGTPSYMSPEQASGQNEKIDGRTDIFALGATGFRLLALRRIHEEDNAVRLVLKMSTEPAPPIRSVAPMVSEPVAAIIDRALAFRPEDRYQTAAAMRADVRAALAATHVESSTHAHAVTLVGPASATNETETTIMLSESDLLPSSPDAPRPVPQEAPREAPQEAPRELEQEAPRELEQEARRELSHEVSDEGSYGLPARPWNSRIPLVTAVFCGSLFFADRWSTEESAAAPEETTSSAPALMPDAAAVVVDAEVARAADPALVPAPEHEHDDLDDAAAEAGAAQDARDGGDAGDARDAGGARDAASASSPPHVPLLPAATVSAKHAPPPPPPPPPSTAKKPPPIPPRPPPPAPPASRKPR